MLLDVCVAVDAVAGERGTDGEAGVRVVGQLRQLGDTFDVDEEVDIDAPSASLDDDVGPAGKGATRWSAIGEQLYRLVDGRGTLIFKGLHANPPPHALGKTLAEDTASRAGGWREMSRR